MMEKFSIRPGPDERDRRIRRRTCEGGAEASRRRGSGAREMRVRCPEALPCRATSASGRIAALFDLAEPVPGPTTAGARAGRRGASASPWSRPVFERRAPGPVPQQRGRHRRRRPDRRPLPQDAHPRRSRLLREVLLHAGRPGLPRRSTRSRRASRRSSAGTSGIRRARGWRRSRARASSSTRRRSAGTRTRRPSTGAAQRDAWRTVQRGARDRQRRLRARRSTASGTSTPGRRRRGIEFWGSFVRRRSAGRRRRRRPRRTARRFSSPRSTRAHRGRAAQLALPARPPHRRLLRDHAPVPRRRPVRLRRDAARLPAAGRVGAARGDLDRLAAQPRPTGRASSARSPGSTARSSASSRPARSCEVLVESKEHEAPRRDESSRAGRTRDASRVEFFRFPTNRGWTRDSGPRSSSAGEAPGDRHPPLPVQRLGALRRLEEGRRDPARRPRRRCGLPLLPGAFRGRETRPGRRRDRRQRRRDAPDDRRVPRSIRKRAGAQSRA